MVRQVMITVLASLYTVCCCMAQDFKDSIYYAKMRAPGTSTIEVFGGKYKVFTQKIGKGKTQLLLLHGGPENTHEYFENFPDQLKELGLTIYYYDQLGSYFSDTPDDSTIWNIPRFIEEVEEVRKGLGLEQFYLLGHSWGGMVAELYAAKYGEHLKGLILSNVPGFIATDASYLNSIIDSINQVVRFKTTMLPAFQASRSEVDSIFKGLSLADPETDKELRALYNRRNDSLFVRTMYYNKGGKLPEPLERSMKHMRFQSIEKYGFDPFEADYRSALRKIKVPTLLIAGKNDFIKPELYDNIKALMTNTKTKVVICPSGAHFTMWDDTACYFTSLIRFFKSGSR